MTAEFMKCTPAVLRARPCCKVLQMIDMFCNKDHYCQNPPYLLTALDAYYADHSKCYLLYFRLNILYFQQSNIPDFFCSIILSDVKL